MNCNPRTLIKAAAVLGAALAVAYYAVPGAQAFILASTPILLALICPVAMIVMMFTMKGDGARKPRSDAGPDQPADHQAVGR
jgi:hypothetical protein